MRWIADQLALTPEQRAAVLWMEPSVGTDEQRLRSARRAGAWVKLLEGSGHWWMTQDDGSVGADALTGFWTALANGRG